jgi:GNAT superfamily N-acetyltransferase
MTAVRAREPGDLPVLLPLLQRTHEREGYPVRAAAVSADWLATPDELDAAVAVDGERVVGHVALHPATEVTALPAWQRAAGRDVDGLAVVSRLFTDRTVPGAGTALLEHAVRRAADLARVAVLLVDPESPARAFYGRRGWREVGTAIQQWGPRTVDAVLMVPGCSPGARVPRYLG